MRIYTEKLLEEKLSTLPTKQRFCFHNLMAYLNAPNDLRVFSLSGLPNTGKTTLMLQAINEINDLDNCLFIACNKNDDFQQLREVLDSHPKCKYIFVDNFTLLSGLGRSSALSDYYTYFDHKIVLAGDNPFAFLELRTNELLDRMHMYSTTYISFSEFTTITEKGLQNYIQTGSPFEDITRLTENQQFLQMLDYVSKSYFSDQADTDSNILDLIDSYRKAEILAQCNKTYVFTQPWMIYKYGISKNMKVNFVTDCILQNIVFLDQYIKYNNRDIIVRKYSDLILKENLIAEKTIIYKIGNESKQISPVMLQKIEKKTGTSIQDIKQITMKNADKLLLE